MDAIRNNNFDIFLDAVEEKNSVNEKNRKNEEEEKRRKVKKNEEEEKKNKEELKKNVKEEDLKKNFEEDKKKNVSGVSVPSDCSDTDSNDTFFDKIDNIVKSVG